MKKHLLSLFALASMVFASSCTSEEIISQSTGNEVSVTFKTELRSDVKSRAVGENAHQIDQVEFAVYGENGYLSDLYKTATPRRGVVTDNEDPNKMYAEINVVLVKGQTYSFAFWAQDKDYDAYEFAPATATVSIDYGKTANNYSADAFFAKINDFTVTGTFEQTVTLKRPFAQVNFLTTATDLDLAKKAGFEPSQSSIVVENAATSLNLLTGNVDGSEKATFTLADLVPDTETTTIKDSNNNGIEFETAGTATAFRYLATAYFLPTEATGEAQITASMSVKGNTSKTVDLTAAGITAQRNYRTNIYGNLLTSNGQFNVVIDPSFDGDHSVSTDEFTTIYTSVNDALIANKANTDAATYNVEAAEGETISNLTITIPDDTKAESLIFNLEDLASGADITITNEDNDADSYNKPVVVEVPAGANLGKLTINLPNAHVTLKNGTYSDMEVTTSNTTLEVGNGTEVTTLIVKQGNVRIVEGGKVESIINSTGKTLYILNAGGTHPATLPEKTIVIYENTEHTYALNNMYSTDKIEDLISYAKNVLGLSDITISLTKDATGDVTIVQEPDVKITLLGNERKFNGVITVDGKSATYITAGLTIKDLNFAAESISADACIRLGVSGDNNTRYTCNVTVSGCTFDVTGAVGVKSYTGGDKNLTITGCTATENAHSLLQAKGIDGILVENCIVQSKNGLNFNNSDNVTVDNYTADVKGYAVRFGESSGGAGAAETYLIKNSTLKSANDDGDAVIVLRGTADNSTLTIENTTLEGNPQITNNAKNAIVIIDGIPTVDSADGLAKVVEMGYTTIKLAAGEYDMPNLSEINGLKLMGESRENTKIKLYNANNGGDFCLANSTATLENMTIITEIKDWAGFQNATNLTFNKCDFVNNLFLSGNATFNECHFTVTTNHYNVWAYSANSRNYTATFNTCVFDCAGKSIYIDGNAGGSTTMNFTGCIFNDNDGGATDKAAIETGTTYGTGATYNVNITDCTFDADGFAINPNGINTNSTIWANKNSMSADKLNIVIDGVDVY